MAKRKYAHLRASAETSVYKFRLGKETIRRLRYWIQQSTAPGDEQMSLGQALDQILMQICPPVPGDVYFERETKLKGPALIAARARMAYARSCREKKTAP